jgi:hypothetical protein
LATPPQPVEVAGEVEDAGDLRSGHVAGAVHHACELHPAEVRRVLAEQIEVGDAADLQPARHRRAGGVEHAGDRRAAERAGAVSPRPRHAEAAMGAVDERAHPVHPHPREAAAAPEEQADVEREAALVAVGVDAEGRDEGGLHRGELGLVLDGQRRRAAPGLALARRPRLALGRRPRLGARLFDDGRRRRRLGRRRRRLIVPGPVIRGLVAQELGQRRAGLIAGEVAGHERDELDHGLVVVGALERAAHRRTRLVGVVNARSSAPIFTTMRRGESGSNEVASSARIACRMASWCSSAPSIAMATGAIGAGASAGGGPSGSSARLAVGLPNVASAKAPTNMLRNIVISI